VPNTTRNRLTNFAAMATYDTLKHMTKQQNTNSKKSQKTSAKNEIGTTYTTLGLVFLIIGAALLISESTRTTGLAFVPVGITFFILGQQKPEPKDKK